MTSGLDQPASLLSDLARRHALNIIRARNETLPPDTTLTQYLEDISLTPLLRYGCLSAAFLIFWDWLTTLDDEITYIWLRRSGMSGRPLYCFIRYGGFAFQIYDLVSQLGWWEHPDVCKVYYSLLPFGTLVFLYAADVLLAYRALCLWRMKRSLVIISCSIFFASVVISGVVSGLTISRFDFWPTPEYLTGCWVDSPSFSFIAPLPGLFFEFWVFGLVIVRAFYYAKQTGGKVNSLGVVKLLIRDSMWWFSVITIMIVLNAIYFAVGPPALTTFFLPYFRGFVIVFGSRSILQMRKATCAAQDAEIPWQMSTRNMDPYTFPPQDGGRKPRAAISIRPSAVEIEAHKMHQALSIAQRIGLPPALPHDLMWYDPLSTLNHHDTANALEMQSVKDPSGPKHAARPSDGPTLTGGSWEEDNRFSLEIRCVVEPFDDDDELEWSVASNGDVAKRASRLYPKRLASR